MKKIILLIFLAAAMFTEDYDGGIVEMQKMIGGTRGREDKTNQQTSNGGCIVAGSSCSVDIGCVSKNGTNGMTDVCVIENRRKRRISIIYYI
jgi:hypothetical protein